MPFIRHTRDKRGYETTYVMHAYRPQAGPQRTRVLYLFRSPSHIKFGRSALDEEAREALEHTHPDVSFDWAVLDRESITVRAEPRERGGRRGRGGTGGGASKPRPVPVILDDQSRLGRVLGAAEAARLRERQADVVQRIARRARTPEERDRLTERAQRLNPDDWPDEAAIRTAVATVDADWDALLADLPARRRGRRGGRRRSEGVAGPEPSSEAADGGQPASSVIIEGQGGSDDGSEEVSPDGGGHDRDAPRDGDRGGSGPAVPGDD